MPKLSLCMIVRDEAELLTRCLESVMGIVDEIVVVDTGSTDQTLAVAERFGAKIGHFTWSDDFAAARNASLALATGDWILVLDADEVLLAPAQEALRTAMASHEEAFLLPIENWTGGGTGAERQTVHLLRLFQNLPGVRYRGRVHEQITESLEALGLHVGFCEALIRHDGYLQRRIDERDKYARNLNILTSSLESQPEDPYAWYQLGKTLLAMGRPDAARPPLEEALRLLEEVSHPESYAYYPMAYAHLASAVEALDGPDAAIAILQTGSARLPAAAELRYRQGIYLRELGMPVEALSAFQEGYELAERERANGTPPKNLRGRLAMAIADLLLQQGRGVDAIAHYRAAIDRGDPSAFEPYLKLANALMQFGDFKGATHAYEEVVRLTPAQFGAQLALGTLYFEQGNLPAALMALEAADRLQPGLPDIHMLIVESKKLLSTLKP